MAQHDYNIANQTGANFRADLNNALSAIVSNNSGSSEPSTIFAYEWWIDTSANVLKLRNSANNAWITMPFSITADNTIDINAGTVNGITSFSFSSGATVTSILDEDNLASDSATALATQQSIKAYVDSQVTAQDLDISDGSSTIAIDLDSETLSLLGGIGVTSTASGNGVTFAIGQSVGTSDNVVFNQVTGALVGNASTATALATARTISGVSFDGTANITLDTDDIGEGSNKYFTAERVDDQVNTLLTAGANISLTYDDAGGTLTIANTNSADITSVVAGDGLTGGGTAGDVTLAVGVDDSSIEINSDALRVKASGITNAMLGGSIANAKLANSSVTINSQAISLGGSHTFDTDDIGEGSSNIYFTDARANSAIDARVTNTFINNLSGVVADTATALATGRTIALSGDVTASGVSFDGTGNISLSTTIAANSVALGTDTTGNYVATIADAGNTRITVANSGSESAAITLDIADDAIGTDQIANNAVALGTQSTGNYVSTIAGTTNEIEVSGSGSETATVTIGLPDDVTIAGNLTVNGTTTTVNSDTLAVTDPLIKLAKANSGADSLDIGFYGLYDTSGSQDLYAGLFRDANDSGKFKLFKDLQTEPTTTVNTSGTGYAVGTLVSNLEGNVTGNVTGNVSGTSGSTTGNAATATALETARTIGGVSFDGTGNIDLAGVNTTGNQDTSGNAATATALATGRTIGMTGDVVWTSASFDGSGNVTGTATIQANSVALGTDTTGDYVGTITGGTGIDSSGATSGEGIAHTLSIDLNELGTETSIAQDDFVAMVDATDDGSGKITFSNLEDEIFGNVSGDIAIAAGGAATIQANSVALGTDTTGDYVSTITGGTGITSTGATSGEGIAHSLSVDASQTQITSVGALDAGSITSGFGSIDVGSSAITTTGTVTGGTLAGTLSTAAQTNITSVGTLSSLTVSGSILGSGDTNGEVSHRLQNINSGSATESTLYITNEANNAAGLFLSTTGTSFTTTGGFVQDSSVVGSGTLASGGLSIMTRANADMRFYTNGHTNERMRIDSAGNVGIGVSSPSTKLHIQDADYTTMSIQAGTTSHGAILNLGDSGDINYGSITQFASSAGEGGRMRFIAGTTETMNLRGGKVGIGTASPSNTLTVNSGSSAVSTKLITTAATGYLQLDNSGGGSGIFSNSDALGFFTSASGTERMRIESGGDVAIGITDADSKLHTYQSAGNYIAHFESANANSYGVWIEAGASANNGYPLLQVTSNAGSATHFRVDSGTGRVGIGTSSPAAPLHVIGNDGVQFNRSGQTNGFIIRPNASTDGIRFTQGGTGDRMTIDSSGQLGIGTTSPSSEFHVKGDAATVARVEPNNNSGKATLLVSSTGSGDGGMQYDANTNNMYLFSYGNMTFNVGTTNLSGNYPANERMRIDSSGNLLVATTSNQGVGGLSFEAGSNGVTITNNTTTGAGNGHEFQVFRRNSTQIGSIVMSNTDGVTYSTSSDARLKNVLGEAKGLEIVNKLNPVNFEWKESKNVQDGLIAQEVEELIPHAVAVSEEGHYSMDYSQVVTPLIKAIQEQQEQIDALQSEINLLKGE